MCEIAKKQQQVGHPLVVATMSFHTTRQNYLATLHVIVVLMMMMMCLGDVGGWLIFSPGRSGLLAINIMVFVVVVHANKNHTPNIIIDSCNTGPVDSQHIENGSGSCLPWGPNESDIQCCQFCHGVFAIAAQYIAPDSQLMNPLIGDNPPLSNNQASCCCYNDGDFVEGSDGTLYYFP